MNFKSVFYKHCVCKQSHRPTITIIKRVNPDKSMMSNSRFQKVILGRIRFIYKIKKLTPDIAVPDSKFTFNKAEYPADVEIIDMR